MGLLATIASRNKMKPEPKFQKVVTSQILSRMRRDSKLISKNPTRFLESIADGTGQYQSAMSNNPTPAFSSFLSTLTTQTASQTYKQALNSLQDKCKQAKSRTLLLNLGGVKGGAFHSKESPRVENKSSRASSARYDLFMGRSIDSVRSNASSVSRGSVGDADMILQAYLEDIRNANVDNIKTWVETSANTQTNDAELPFGLPTSGVLRIPTKNLAVVTSLIKQDFLKNALEEFFLLDAEYHAKLEELSAKITDNIREFELADWPSKDSALLFHLMNLTGQNKSHQHFSAEKLCTEVATRLFLKVHSRDNIIAHKYLLKVKKALEEKRSSVIKGWLQDKSKLVKKVNLAWEDIQRQEQRKEEWAREKKLQQEKCQMWVDLLEKMRNENRAKVRAISSLVEPLEEEQRRQQKAKEDQERIRRMEQKQLLEKFQRIKLEHDEEEKRHQEEIQEKLEKDKRIRKIQNMARVHLRHQEWREKKEYEKEIDRRKREDQRIREEILERSKEKVNVSWAPWNILNDTHASLVRSHEIQTLISIKNREEEEAVKFFQERYSFSAETLWKDSRVRLESKLRDAGLIGNSYARNVLLAMQPKEKPHLKSNIKFNNDEETKQST